MEADIVPIGMRSLSARRAWIEMFNPGRAARPRPGSLSARRAWIEMSDLRHWQMGHRRVALRKESVDRNHLAADCASGNPTSLSARRAWIEIDIRSPVTKLHSVALRKESVDRNPKQDGNWGWGEESLSARRAWIEIQIRGLV